MSGPSSIIADAQSAAEWVATALVNSGYRTDFTPASLHEIDRFFDEHSSGGSPRPGGLLAEDLGRRLFAIGSYVGEVLRSHTGGTWEADDSDPQAEINLTLRLTDGSAVWPVQRCMKRYQLGAEASIAAYGAALGLRVGASPARKKPWWRFW